MVGNGKAMSLVLQSGDEFKSLTMLIDGDLLIVKIKTPGPMAVVLYHTAHRNGKIQLL